jgi:hypothetical protein
LGLLHAIPLRFVDIPEQLPACFFRLGSLELVFCVEDAVGQARVDLVGYEVLEFASAF